MPAAKKATSAKRVSATHAKTLNPFARYVKTHYASAAKKVGFKTNAQDPKNRVKSTTVIKQLAKDYRGGKK